MNGLKVEILENGTRYKGESKYKGDVIDVPKSLAGRWLGVNIAKPYKEEPEKETTENVDTGEEKITFDDLEQKGSYYYFPDGSKAHGQEKAEKKLTEWNEGD